MDLEGKRVDRPSKVIRSDQSCSLGPLFCEGPAIYTKTKTPTGKVQGDISGGIRALPSWSRGQYYNKE